MFKFGKSKKEDAPSPSTAATSAAVNASATPSPISKEPIKVPVSTATPPPKAEGNTATPPPVSSAATTPVPFQHGLLSFKLLETRGLKMPAESNVTPGGPSGKDVGCLPFAVIELDKNEVIMRSVEANPIENTVIFQTKANL